MAFLGIFIFFIFLVAYFRKKGTREQAEKNAQFWERENAANGTRRQDISGLPYITIPLSQFPIGSFEDGELKEAERVLLRLSDEKILNLVGQTNTDLKLAYGAANLPALSQCDQNFTLLCRTLVSYAKRLLALGHGEEARAVLEFGISCGSDASQNYLLLAQLYKDEGRDDAIEGLIGEAGKLHSAMRDSIVRRLGEMREE